MNATNTNTSNTLLRDIMKWFTSDPTHLKIHPATPDPCDKIYKRMVEPDAYAVFRSSLQTPRNNE